MTAAVLERPATAAAGCPQWCAHHDVNNCGEVFHQSAPYVQVLDDFLSDGLIVDICQNDDPDGYSTGPVICLNWSMYGTFPCNEHIALTPQDACNLGWLVKRAADTSAIFGPTVFPSSNDERQTVGVEFAPERMTREGQPFGPYVLIAFQGNIPSAPAPVVIHLDVQDAVKLGDGLTAAYDAAVTTR